jgi:hypothetical protein
MSDLTGGHRCRHEQPLGYGFVALIYRLLRVGIVLLVIAVIVWLVQMRTGSRRV